VSPVTGGSQATIPPPNLNCILACTKQFRSCWNKGVDRELCIKRLQRCILACMGIRNIDDGGGLVPDIE
jgi:hypothetical protein